MPLSSLGPTSSQPWVSVLSLADGLVMATAGRGRGVPDQAGTGPSSPSSFDRHPASRSRPVPPETARVSRTPSRRWHNYLAAEYWEGPRTSIPGSSQVG
jgi:hypothetical protein